MKIPSNFHTHTLYCDGKNTAQELVQTGILQGCAEIGFSGHSYTPFDPLYCMSPEGTRLYQAEIRALKEKYKDKIRILLGVEQDYYSEESTEAYDYIIGSVHYVKKEGLYLPVDESREKQLAAVSLYYGGDFYAFIDDYYRNLADIVEKTGCHIVGHFDVITKFNEGNALFDTADRRYRKSVEKALDALLAAPVCFEINTGAVAKGYRRQAYPEDFILRELLRHKKKLILSSDCHERDKLLFGMQDYPFIQDNSSSVFLS